MAGKEKDSWRGYHAQKNYTCVAVRIWSCRATARRRGSYNLETRLVTRLRNGLYSIDGERSALIHGML